ncbi:unnamed protein product [Owenia fusiformis]|uniref:VWFA domain-containing protein n=1 Tax=Owenia fusiformis TaxID=6347 RepID=A0A8S4Q5Q3_OWEFU|nr:unnamed protein product [Owenia fusiformis]
MKSLIFEIVLFYLCVNQSNGSTIIDRLTLLKNNIKNNQVQIIELGNATNEDGGKQLSGRIVLEDPEPPIVPAGGQEPTTSTPELPSDVLYDMTEGLDIVIAMDMSCSILQEDKNKTIDLVYDLFKSFLEILEKSRITVVTFSKSLATLGTVTTSREDDHDTLAGRIAGINITERNCKTRSYQAFEQADNMFCWVAKDDGIESVPCEYSFNLLLVVGDGRSWPVKSRVKTLNLAVKMKKNDVRIIWVETPTRVLKRDIPSDILEVVSDESLIFRMDNFTNTRLVQKLLRVSTEIRHDEI